MLKTWKNGEKAVSIQKVIDDNFKILGKYLSQNILALSTAEISALQTDYTSEGLRVFDKTKEKWMKYESGVWVEDTVGNSSAYVKTISKSDWNNGEITIPKSTHGRTNPFVDLYVYNNGVYEDVVGGVRIDSEYNVILKSDLSFDGKVVIR